MKRAESLRPGDVAVALRLVLKPEEGYEDLGRVLGIGRGAAHRAVRRLEKAQLLQRDRRAVLVKNLAEFVIHGLRYAFYADLGAETLGIPTAVMSDMSEGGRIFVWPSPSGTHRGMGVPPLLPQAVHLPQRDADLYRALSIIDVLRIGSARERGAAGRSFEDWLSQRSA